MNDKSTYLVRDIETDQLAEMTVEQLLDEINRDRSDGWTDYTADDWRDGMEHFTDLTLVTRVELENKALNAVCACHAYDLAENLDEVSDEDLRSITEDPQWVHKEQQRRQPVAEAEYLEGLAACPEAAL